MWKDILASILLLGLVIYGLVCVYLFIKWIYLVLRDVFNPEEDEDEGIN